MDSVKALLPKDKFDDSNIAKLAELNDEEIKPIICDLFEWLQDANWPIFGKILLIIADHQNIVMPHVIEVLQSKQGEDVMWQYWIISQLIPLLSSDNKLLLKSDLVRLAASEEKDEDTLEIVEASKECLKMYYPAV